MIFLVLIFGFKFTIFCGLTPKIHSKIAYWCQKLSAAQNKG